MNKIILNIGLKVGKQQPVNQEQLVYTHLLRLGFHPNSFKVVEQDGGNWGKENVAVIELLLHDINLHSFIKAMEILCTLVHQDAIAFTYMGEGHLAFNPSYEGERFKFNLDYFIQEAGVLKTESV